ncbi:MAG: hypothetical protein FWF10_11210 [Clostridiales bacterium]|nr:hypothetical protein [Clostridiales bacterium]
MEQNLHLNPDRILEMTQLKILHRERQHARRQRFTWKPSRALVVTAAYAAVAIMLGIGVYAVLQRGAPIATTPGDPTPPGVSAVVPIPRFMNNNREQSGYTVSEAGAYYMGDNIVYSLSAGLSCWTYEWLDNGDGIFLNTGWVRENAHQGIDYAEIHITERAQPFADFDQKSMEEWYYYSATDGMTLEQVQASEGGSDFAPAMEHILETLRIEKLEVAGYPAVRLYTQITFDENGQLVPNTNPETKGDTQYKETWFIQGPHGAVQVHFENYAYVNQRAAFMAWTQDIMAGFLLDYEIAMPAETPIPDPIIISTPDPGEDTMPVPEQTRTPDPVQFTTPMPHANGAIIPVPQQHNDYPNGEVRTIEHDDFTVSQKGVRYGSEEWSYSYILPAGYTLRHVQRGNNPEINPPRWLHMGWIDLGKNKKLLWEDIFFKEIPAKPLSFQTASDLEWYSYTCYDAAPVSQEHLDEIKLVMDRTTVAGRDAIRLGYTFGGYCETWIIDTPEGILIIYSPYPRKGASQKDLAQAMREIIDSIEFS